MANFSLADIRAAADKKYAHLDIELHDGSNLRLTNALQLPQAKRTELMAKQEALGEADADQVELLSDCLRIVATNAEYCERLLNEVGGNLALLIQIFSSYNQDTELGEA